MNSTVLTSSFQARTLDYASFWERFIAFIIDSLIIGFITGALYLLSILFIGLFFIAAVNPADFFSNHPYTFPIGMLSFFMITGVCSAILGWLYFAIMESSSRQATFGKIALGLKVTDLNGERISFGDATIRHFGKILSHAFFFLGYIMSAFTQRRQALHDLISNCLVIKK